MIVWLHMLLNGKVDCPALLRNINFMNSGGKSTTRSQDIFERQFDMTSYQANSAMARVRCLGYTVYGELEFFRDSQGRIRRVDTSIE